MQSLRTVLLMPDEIGKEVLNLADKIGIELNALIVNDLNSLETAFNQNHDLLLAFCTGVIVPAWILKAEKLLAINVHAASPKYPGRDPHHFAVYDDVKQYGATLHYMTEIVDQGTIIDVEYFDVIAGITPSSLLERSMEAGWILINRLLFKMQNSENLQPMECVSWGNRITTRSMFLDLCRIDQNMTETEIERRIKATAMPGYNNTYIDIHGYRFRLEGLVE